MAIWLAAIAVTGTLLGTALGWFITSKLQRAERDHLDRIRFHEKRLATYTEFLTRAAEVFVRMSSDSVSEPLWAHLHAARQMITLVATEPVVLQANAISELLSSWTSLGEAVKGREEWMFLRLGMENAVRRELGMDTLPFVIEMEEGDS